MDDITFVRSHWWLVSEVFHYRPPTPMYRNSPPLCTIVLQIPSLMPLKMRKVQLCTEMKRVPSRVAERYRLNPVARELRSKVFSIGQLAQPRRSPGRLRRPRTRGLALSILRTPLQSHIFQVPHLRFWTIKYEIGRPYNKRIRAGRPR